MINFTGIIQVGRRYYNTDKIISWEQYNDSGFLSDKDKSTGTTLLLDNNDEIKLKNVTPEQFQKAYIEAQENGFTILA